MRKAYLAKDGSGQLWLVLQEGAGSSYRPILPFNELVQQGVKIDSLTAVTEIFDVEIPEEW